MSDRQFDEYSGRVPEPPLVESKSGDVRILRAPPGASIGEGQVQAFLLEVASRALAPGSLVALDVSSVEFFGVDDIDTLIALHDRVVGEGGHFVVFGANGVVRDVLHLAGLDALIGVFAVERAAVEHLRDSAAGPWH